MKQLDTRHYVASTAGGLSNCNGAAFAPLKKYAVHFFNAAFGGTEAKEAPYAVTGRKRESGLSAASFLRWFKQNLCR